MAATFGQFPANFRFSGAMLFTEQEAAGMSRNKIIKFNTQGDGWNQNTVKKGRAPREVQQMCVFELATQNRLWPLQHQQGNC